ncbi:MAG: response regulator [Candidatus Omnitrophica bacterium]|nr:response regulator [Candidatus Omnitrophota bacterium]
MTKHKILVIDDEAEICDALKMFLTQKGYDVMATTSATEGIELVKTEKPKVILLDIRMPDMTGLEAIKKIREVDENVGIIMATAVVDEDIAKETIKLGASDYIIKPFDLDYLERSLLVKISTLT